MAFVTGSSCFLHFPLSHFPFLSSSSSPRSRSCVSYAQTKSNFRGIRAPVAWSHQEDPRRRSLPLLGLKLNAVEPLPIKESEVKTTEYNQNHRIAPQESRSFFLSSLSGRFGIVSLMLGFAFGYAVDQQERAAANATIETMNRKLKEQEELISLLESNYGAMLLNEQKEQTKQLGREKDEQNALMNQLNSANSTIIFIEQEMQSKEILIEELKLQIDNLETQLAKAVADKKDAEKNLEEKTDSGAKLVREKEEELHQLREKFEHALKEGSRNQVIIAELTQEREILRDSLENESKKTNNLMSELQITQENHGKTRNEAAQLEKHINESYELHKELEAEVSKLSVELSVVSESLQRKLADEKHRVERLTTELSTAKEDLKKSQFELLSMSHELTEALENRGSLQRELIDAYKKVKTAMKDLKEEKMLVASLNKDVQALESQVLKEREIRRSLELNLEETTKSLDEMKRNALILSGQLNSFNSRILNLEDDKEGLHKLLADQNTASKETQKILEDAHNHIRKLGMERENLESKARKLEEELASAKGEILRLKNQKISSSKVVTNDEDESKVTVNNVQKKG